MKAMVEGDDDVKPIAEAELAQLKESISECNQQIASLKGKSKSIFGLGSTKNNDTDSEFGDNSAETGQVNSKKRPGIPGELSDETMVCGKKWKDAKWFMMESDFMETMSFRKASSCDKELIKELRDLQNKQSSHEAPLSNSGMTGTKNAGS